MSTCKCGIRDIDAVILCEDQLDSGACTGQHDSGVQTSLNLVCEPACRRARLRLCLILVLLLKVTPGWLTFQMESWSNAIYIQVN